MGRRSKRRRIARAGALSAAAPPARRRSDQLAAVGYYEQTRRPLHCLVFLLPMVVAYEVGMAMLHDGRAGPPRPDLAAQLLLQWFFSLFGATGYYLPGFALVAVLLAWHVATGQTWRIRGATLAGMAAESVLWALPLLAMNQLIRGPSLMAGAGDSILRELLLSIGAGLYEELLFRLMIIAFLMFVFQDVLGMRPTAAAALAVIVSSAAFAAHHYQPIGSDRFSAGDFCFRAAAGGYLACLFVFRGFGIAVGCHAIYDVIVVAAI